MPVHETPAAQAILAAAIARADGRGDRIALKLLTRTFEHIDDVERFNNRDPDNPYKTRHILHPALSWIVDYALSYAELDGATR